MARFNEEKSNPFHSRDGFVRRVNILFLSSLLFGVLLVFFLVYRPMRPNWKKV